MCIAVVDWDVKRLVNASRPSGLSSKYKVLIIVVVVVAVALVSVVIALPYIQQAIAQPNIVLTEVQIDEGEFCGDDIFYFFTLVNSGNADGFANVEFLMDGGVDSEQDYFVPAGATIERSFIIPLPPEDCFFHDPEMRIASMWKA